MICEENVISCTEQGSYVVSRKHSEQQLTTLFPIKILQGELDYPWWIASILPLRLQAKKWKLNNYKVNVTNDQKDIKLFNKG